MTLIATFAVEGFPIAFGDLLLTGMTINENAVAVPALGEVQNFFGEDSGWSVRGLVQKLNLISDHCVVGWTGGLDSSRFAINELRRMSLEGDLTVDAVMEYLGNDPKVRADNDSFVGLIADNNGLHCFQIRADPIMSASLGQVYRVGSGSTLFDEIEGNIIGMETRKTGNANPVASGISMGLMLGGMLLDREFRGGVSAETIQHMFGGGYEIAFFVNGKMQKLQDVTYLFWEANLPISGGVQLAAPHFLVKQQYLNDNLIIRSVKAEASEKGMEVVDEQWHVISPLYETVKPTEPEIKAVTLYSPLICHFIMVNKEGQRPSVYTRVQLCSSKEDAVFNFDEQGDKILFGFNSEAIEQIARALEKFRS